MYQIDLLIICITPLGSQKRRRERLILPAAHELDSSLTEGTQIVRQGGNIKEQKKK